MEKMNRLNNKVIKNASWLMTGRIIQKGLSFVVSILTARFLGVSNFGLINYAAAYISFFSAVCTLGINSVIVKNFVDYPEEQGETIGSAFVLRLISSIFSMIIIVLFVSFIDRNEPLTICVVALCSISVVFQIFDTLNYWFQSRLQSKVTAIATLVAYTIVSTYKIILLICQKDVRWFALSTSVEYIVLALLLMISYKRNNGPKMSVSVHKAKQLLKSSHSFIFSGLMISIYNCTDRLMLKQMLDESSVAYYSLAVSISTMWVFVLSAIIDSMYPVIMRYHNENYEKYVRTNKQLYAIVFYVSLIASAIICFVAPFFVGIIYGEAYLPAVTPLRIVVWYTSFSYLGVARDAWVVSENKQKYLKYLYFGSAVVNVLLNFILIPSWGASGAAFASLITQVSTILFMPALIKAMRPNVRMMIEAFLLRDVGDVFSNWLLRLFKRKKNS